MILCLRRSLHLHPGSDEEKAKVEAEMEAANKASQEAEEAMVRRVNEADEARREKETLLDRFAALMLMLALSLSLSLSLTLALRETTTAKCKSNPSPELRQNTQP